MSETPVRRLNAEVKKINASLSALDLFRCMRSLYSVLGNLQQ